MGAFANRWRTLREAASTEAASSAMEPPQEPQPVPLRRAGKLRDRLALQQDGQPGPE